MSGVLQSSVAVTASQLHDLSERMTLVEIAGWSDLCHCCDSYPADNGGVLCKSCRAKQEKESE